MYFLSSMYVWYWYVFEGGDKGPEGQLFPLKPLRWINSWRNMTAWMRWYPTKQFMIVSFQCYSSIIIYIGIESCKTYTFYAHHKQEQKINYLTISLKCSELSSSKTQACSHNLDLGAKPHKIKALGLAFQLWTHDTNIFNYRRFISMSVIFFQPIWIVILHYINIKVMGFIYLIKHYMGNFSMYVAN